MGQELRTPLCREFGIEYPVFNAGIGMAAGPELAAAVSNAGGFGVVGASAYLPEQIPGLVARTRKLTDRPFGLNIIIAEDNAPSATDDDRTLLHQQISAAIDVEVAALVLFWGDPGPYVKAAHDKGVKLLIQVGSVEEARAAATTGVDAVIAQGVEAGGHVRGMTSIWTLIPAVVEAIKPMPVLASGGIGDGAGLARALQLGAQGVSLGTRFIASNEANVHPAYQQRILKATAADTVHNYVYDIGWPDAPSRTIRNKTISEWEAAGRPPSGQRPGEGTSIGKRRNAQGAVMEWPRYAIGVATPDFDGDIEYAPLWAGESCSVINDVKPAAEIVADLVRDAQAALLPATPRG